VQSMRRSLQQSSKSISQIVKVHNRGVAAFLPVTQPKIGGKRGWERCDMSVYLIDVPSPTDLSCSDDDPSLHVMEDMSLPEACSDVTGDKSVVTSVSQLKSLLRSQENEQVALKLLLSKSKKVKKQLEKQIEKNNAILAQLVATNLKFKQEIQLIRNQLQATEIATEMAKKRPCYPTPETVPAVRPVPMLQPSQVHAS